MVVVGLVVVAAGVASWLTVPGAVAIGQTGVLLDARPFTCARPGDVTTWAQTDFVDPGARVHLPAVRLHPGMDCTMDVVVRNDSDAVIAVDSITIPLAGATNGIGIHAYRAIQQGLSPAGGHEARDAVFDYQHDPRAGGSYAVAAHSVQRFSVRLSWSDGCVDDGAASSFIDAPTAVISAGPWHIAKSWSGAGYAFLGGRNTLAARCSS